MNVYKERRIYVLMIAISVCTAGLLVSCSSTQTGSCAKDCPETQYCVKSNAGAEVCAYLEKCEAGKEFDAFGQCIESCKPDEEVYSEQEKKCVAKCSDSSQCSAEQQCDTEKHYCTARSCQSANDCSDGLVCNSALKICVAKACSSDNDCSDGRFCDQDGRCKEKDIAVCAQDCKEGEICGNDGQCEPAPETQCSEKNPCPEGKICGNDGQCEPAPETQCSEKNPCPEGKICGNDGQCEPVLETQCGDSSVCPDHQVCGDDGRCAERECKDSKDCPDNYQCKDNICHRMAAAFCKTDEECGSGQHCMNNLCQNAPYRYVLIRDESSVTAELRAEDPNIGARIDTIGILRKDEKVPSLFATDAYSVFSRSDGVEMVFSQEDKAYANVLDAPTGAPDGIDLDKPDSCKLYKKYTSGGMNEYTFASLAGKGETPDKGIYIANFGEDFEFAAGDRIIVYMINNCQLTESGDQDGKTASPAMISVSLGRSEDVNSEWRELFLGIPLGGIWTSDEITEAILQK